MARTSSNLSQEAARRIFSALVTSDFEVDELRTIARRLQGGDIIQLVHVLLMDFCFTLNPRSHQRESMQKAPPQAHSKGGKAVEPNALTSLRKTLLAGIRGKKMSRAKFARKVEDSLRIGRGDISHENASMEDLVNLFLANASKSQVEKFQREFASGDPYLQGISNR